MQELRENKMGKSHYEKPYFRVEQFTPNEFVAVCNPPYSAVCGVGNKTGVLFQDNGDGKLGPGDFIVNKRYGNWFNIYKRCNLPHDVTHEQYDKMTVGFLVPSNAARNAKDWNWNTLFENDMRSNFKFNQLEGVADKVWIWNEDYSTTQRGWHATPVKGGITTNHS